MRLKNYDYSSPGAYFITVCVNNYLCLFGEISEGKMTRNKAGIMIQKEWIKLTQRFQHIELSEYIVMPNHFHAILHITPRLSNAPSTRTGEHKVRPYTDNDTAPRGTLPNTLGRIMQAFKSITTHEYINGVKQYGWPRFDARLWHRNYWEHVVRNEDEYSKIAEYIRNNPAKWDLDKLNPKGESDNRTNPHCRGESCIRPSRAGSDRADCIRPTSASSIRRGEPCVRPCLGNRRQPWR